MRLLAYVLAALLLAPAMQTAADDATAPVKQLEQASREADAAFECAALAMNAKPGSRERRDAARLFRFGYGSALSAVGRIKEVAKPEAITDQEILFLFEMSDEFWVAMGFAKAIDRAEEFLVEKVPYGSERSLEQIDDARQLLAAIEFGSKNCSLIGPR